MREKVWVPVTGQIQKAMEVAETSVEAADYLVTRFTEILAQARLSDKPDGKAMLARVEDYAKYVKFKLNSSAQPWIGEEGATTGFKIMQENLARDAAALFKEEAIEGDLRLDFAVSNKSEFIRGYSADTKALPSKVVEQLDKLFNAFLAESSVVGKGGVLYQADEKGEILANQGSLEEHAQNMRELIKNDFEDYMQDKEIPLSVYQQPYPDQTQEKQVQKTVSAAVESVVESTQKAEVEPQAPRTNL
jgi:hypothetical protein